MPAELKAELQLVQLNVIPSDRSESLDRQVGSCRGDCLFCSRFVTSISSTFIMVRCQIPAHTATVQQIRASSSGLEGVKYYWKVKWRKATKSQTILVWVDGWQHSLLYLHHWVGWLILKCRILKPTCRYLLCTQNMNIHNGPTDQNWDVAGQRSRCNAAGWHGNQTNGTLMCLPAKSMRH